MKQKLSHLDQEFDRLQHLTDLDEILDLQVCQPIEIYNIAVCQFGLIVYGFML